MKNLLIPIVSFALCISSCTDDEPDSYSTVSDKTNTDFSTTIISFEEAANFANHSYNIFFESHSRNDNHKSASAENVSVIDNTTSRLSSDTSLYVVNFPDEGGYVIMAAAKYSDKRLLAIVQHGSLNPLKEINNPGLRLFINDALTYTMPLGDTFIKPPFSPVTQEKVERDTTIQYWTKPKTGLEWGQDGIYGKYCDNGVCGCFATAAAMTMALYQHPNSIYINFKNNIAQSITKTISPNWNDIKKHINSNKFNFESATTESKDNIGLICRQVGEIANCDYSTDTPNTSGPNVVNALKTIFQNKNVSHFQEFHPDKYEYKIDEIRDGINNGIVLMAGSRTIKDRSVGHIWLIEGYKQIKIRKQRYEKNYYELSWTLKETTETCEDFFYHNWGWHGKDNGYFSTLSTSISPQTGMTYSDLRFLTIK